MKIIILVRILWSAGTQKTAILGAKHLQDLGNEVEIIFIRKGKTSFIYEQMLKGVKYSFLNSTDKNSSILTPLFTILTSIYSKNLTAPWDLKKEMRIDYDLLRRFPKFIKNKKPDKIICHDEYAGIAGYFAFKKLKIPYDVFLHEHLMNCYLESMLA